MPTRDELATAWDEGYAAAEYMAKCWGHVDSWEGEPSNPYRAAEPGVAVPEPDEQRCGHCDGTGEWVQPWGAGRVLIKDCEYCKGTGRPAASPVAQEDQQAAHPIEWCGNTCGKTHAPLAQEGDQR